MDCIFNVGSVLEIILKVIKKNANILAHSYLLKDESIISKWKNNKVLPRNDDIAGIVKFVLGESTSAQRKIVRDQIEELVNRSTLKDELKNIILNTADFGDFIKEALSVSVTVSQNSHEPKKCSKNESPGENVITDMVENGGGRYTGTLEFDLVIPDNQGIKAQDPSGIEFRGKVNLIARNKLIHVAKYVRKKSAFGAIVLWIVAGTFFIAYYAGAQNNRLEVLSSKDTGTSNHVVALKQDAVITPIPATTVKPSFTPVPSSASAPKKEPVAKPSSTALAGKEKAQTVTKTKNTQNTTVDNRFGNSPVNINGNGNFFLEGDQNVIGFEKN